MTDPATPEHIPLTMPEGDVLALLSFLIHHHATLPDDVVPALVALTDAVVAYQDVEDDKVTDGGAVP